MINRRKIIAWLVVLIGWLVVSNLTVFALTADQKKVLDSGIYYFNVEEATQPSCSAGTLPGNNNAEKAWNFFGSKGLTPAQVAGIIGNLQAESGQDIDPNATNSSGYRGIAQWDPAHGGRWETFVNWATENGRDPLNFDTQLEYVFEEGTQRGNIDGLKAYDDVPHTAWFWGRFYEGAVIGGSTSTEPLTNVQDLAKRTEYAQTAMTNFGGQSPQSGGSCVGVGGVDRFPLQATQAQIEAGSSNGSATAVWCFSRDTNCHHDYNAADIHVLEGTPVLAAKAGHVVSTHDSTGGSSVTIHGDDDKFTYYYTHMGLGTLLVAEGDDVTVGQPIGAVGNSTSAEGSAPHLHFDMLPADQYQYRPACSDAACSSYPFVDVQPILKQVYESQVVGK